MLNWKSNLINAFNNLAVGYILMGTAGAVLDNKSPMLSIGVALTGLYILGAVAFITKQLEE